MSKPALADEIPTPEPFLPGEPEGPLAWWQRRDWFRASFEKNPMASIEAEEIEAHFSGMPPYYWERVNGADLTWGLETIHGFLRLVAAPAASVTTPFVNWRQVPGEKRTRLMLCTWDRQGLLAKATAAFSGVRLSIVEADVFTRADNMVLDVFSVVDTQTNGAASPERLQEMSFLLDGALSDPPRFASLWACSRHKFLGLPSEFPPRFDFDNSTSTTTTLVRMEACDRLGLLYDVLDTLADAGLNVRQARIATQGDIAHDIFHVTDDKGLKVTDPARLVEIRQRLEAVLRQ